VAAVLWGLWKARNDLVFNANPATSTMVLRRVCDDLALSRWRYQLDDRDPFYWLRSFFSLVFGMYSGVVLSPPLRISPEVHVD
jgi:hypothetical protein